MEALTGKPGNGARRESDAVGTIRLWYTATEARMRKLGNRPTLEPIAVINRVQYNIRNV
jgi:hypothetical protein